MAYSCTFAVCSRSLISTLLCEHEHCPKSCSFEHEPENSNISQATCKIWRRESDSPSSENGRSSTPFWSCIRTQILCLSWSPKKQPQPFQHPLEDQSAPCVTIGQSHKSLWVEIGSSLGKGGGACWDRWRLWWFFQSRELLPIANDGPPTFGKDLDPCSTNLPIQGAQASAAIWWKADCCGHSGWYVVSVFLSKVAYLLSQAAASACFCGTHDENRKHVKGRVWLLAFISYPTVKLTWYQF